MDIVHEIREETRTLIDDTVKEHLHGFNIEPCFVFAYLDNDGEEGISVGICYNDSSVPVDPRKITALVGSLRDRLVGTGEFRSPYVRHYFQEGQIIEGMSDVCSAA